jgi:hypothetical protein
MVQQVIQASRESVNQFDARTQLSANSSDIWGLRSVLFRIFEFWKIQEGGKHSRVLIYL